MIPNITKGADMRGLIRYLVGPGRANEHVDPHVISGDDFLQAWYGAEVLDQTSVVGIADYLDAPRRTFGTEVRGQVTAQDPETGAKVVQGYKDQHVWQCSLSLRAEDGPLSDERWDTIARGFMDRMGFTETSGKAPCRWVAIHHGPSTGGNDHIHLAASMVRTDGTRWEGRWGDFPRSQEVCRELEVEHDLSRVEGPVQGIAQRGEKRAEREAAASAGLGATAPKELGGRLRAAAVASTSEAEWVRRARADGVVVKPRYAPGTTEVVVGYRAALKPADYAEKLVFYRGSSLGRDLSLPRLRENWAPPGVEAAAEAVAEWQAAFRGAPPTRTGREGTRLDGLAPGAQDVAAARLAGWNERLRGVPVTDRVAWADAARDGAGILTAWSRLDPEHGGELRAAAAALTRSAQLRRAPLEAGRRVKESPMGTALILLAAAPDTTNHSTDNDGDNDGGSGRARVAGAVFLRQVIKTAQALRDHHTAAGQLGEARAVQREVVERLERIQLVGYRSPSPTGVTTGVAAGAGKEPEVPVGAAQRESAEARRLADLAAPRPPTTRPQQDTQPGTGPLPRPLDRPRAPGPGERSGRRSPGRSGNQRDQREGRE